MEPKKNPRYDIHRKRGLLFNISLSVSILLVLGLLHVPIRGHRAFDPPVPYTEPDVTFTRDPLPALAKQKEAVKQRKEQTQKPKSALVNLVSVDTDPEEIFDPHLIDMATDQTEFSLDFGDIADEKPPANETFIAVEVMPEPVGGWEAFYGTIQENLHYPTAAIRGGVEGKVFITFVVNEKGEVVELSILKGIGYGCDEEALRVVSLPKWKAGKQRGRPVRVRMAQAINFQLN